jgi:ankyrin repeat protein
MAEELTAELKAALAEGDPREVARLIAAGADVHYRDEEGYDALVHAVHGRDVERDARLIELLEVLIAAGVDLHGVTRYQESGLRVLSRLGRFDGVKRLLDAGADKGQLQWTPLIEAVALGSAADVGREIAAGGGAALEEVDWWSRTAWLVALVVGDRAKVELLRAAGANVNACGRAGQRPLIYAIQGHHPELVRWLLDIGQAVDGSDDFGTTPLMRAVDDEDLACVEVLLAAGADLARDAAGTALSRAGDRTIAMRLLEAGADPKDLPFEGRRALLGLPPWRDDALMTATRQAFRRGRTRSFGASNPERANQPFWQSMIRSGMTAWAAAKRFEPGKRQGGPPVWCAQRFGQSLTFLPDGRVVQIGGEHEDYYDVDFCIYNDVFVHALDGSIAIYGYPEADFPPTDFHTATLVDDHIYVIGSLGYAGARRFGETPLHRLDVRSFRMERLSATGDAPGWIFRHRAIAVSPREIAVSGGTIATLDGDKQSDAENGETYVLDLERLRWRRGAGAS